MIPVPEGSAKLLTGREEAAVDRDRMNEKWGPTPECEVCCARRQWAPAPGVLVAAGRGFPERPRGL